MTARDKCTAEKILKYVRWDFNNLVEYYFTLFIAEAVVKIVQVDSDESESRSDAWQGVLLSGLQEDQVGSTQLLLG